jgi:guanyl-specific ribonuclease Sa
MKRQPAIRTRILAAFTPIALSRDGAMTAAVTATAQQLAVSHTPTAVASQPDAGMQVTGKPVARVNGTVLTDRDLQREMFTLFPYAAQHNGQVPPEMEPQLRKGASADDCV